MLLAQAPIGGFSLNKEITCGIGVLMGQPCIHKGFLQLRHLFASVEIYKAIKRPPDLNLRGKIFLAIKDSLFRDVKD